MGKLYDKLVTLKYLALIGLSNCSPEFLYIKIDSLPNLSYTELFAVLNYLLLIVLRQ